MYRKNIKACFPSKRMVNIYLLSYILFKLFSGGFSNARLPAIYFLYFGFIATINSKVAHYRKLISVADISVSLVAEPRLWGLRSAKVDILTLGLNL